MASDETLDMTRSLLGSTHSTGIGTPSNVTVVGDPTDFAQLECGMRLGEYVIERPLGSGGMGQVFAARSPSGELVALKYLERAGARMLYRFKQEFRALADVTHENLVSLGELVVLDEGTFFTMEIVDGVPFDEYVRGRTPVGRLPNIARLERALRQLVLGIRHLHHNGCVHRDLKPSNVLVTREGRVVILDFGLVQDHSETEALDTGEDQLMGTPAYMSPEQAGLERAGPAADYYALGVMLYECLTGHRPFRGSITNVLFAKQELEPPPVSEVIADAPPHLVELCRRLLARDPRARPGGGEILRLLGKSAGKSGKGQTSGLLPLAPTRPDPEELAEAVAAEGSMSAGRAVFVGRQRELALLEQAYSAVSKRRSAVTVHVRGPSGFGKSTLVHEYLSDLREREGALVLRGRCLERESVPYKGVDAVIDALSVHLRGLAGSERAILQPSNPGALARLFPVLAELWVDEGERTSGLDPAELRARAFEALREVFGRIAARRPLALFVDNFHWGDIDSARLLTELVRPPDPPALLLIVSFREPVEQFEALRALLAGDAIAGRDIRDVPVGPLSEPEARELAATLLGATAVGSPRERDELLAKAEAYARGAGGSPFFVGQLVRTKGSGQVGGTSQVELDKIVARRVFELPAAQRTLLTVVAVASGPIKRRVAFEVAGLAEPEPVLEALVEAELLRSRGTVLLRARGGDMLETAHDRIREVTVGELEADELADMHRRLARALERSGGDPETLAEHYERAGEPHRAARYYERAAMQAASTLAFQRAVELFRKTIALLRAHPSRDADSDIQTNELEVVNRIDALELNLANQLINVGRGREAAQLLLGLAERSADPAKARELRRRGADQLIKTGYVDEGLAELDRLLRSVGLKLPSNGAAALATLLVEQSRVLLRGRKFVRRDASEIDPALLDRIDTCFAVVNGLSTQEILLSAIFHFRNLRYSLDSGEPYRVARALAYQCVVDVAGRKWGNVEEQFTTARSLAAQFGDARLLGFIDLCEASVHWFERRYPVSSEMHRKVIDTLEGVAGANWDRRTAQDHHFWTMVCQGKLEECHRLARGYLERARERSDMQEVIEISAMLACAQTYAGQLIEARKTLAEGRAAWNPGRYLFGDVWAAYAEIRLLLCEGKPEQAVAFAKQTLADMRKTFLTEHLLARHNVEELIARSSLHAALAGGGWAHARRARRGAASLRSKGNPVLLAQAAVIEAGLATLVNQRDRARQCWEEAATLLRAHKMEGYLAAVSVRLAEVSEGERAEQLRAEARVWFDREKVVDVDGFVQLVAPARTGQGALKRS